MCLWRKFIYLFVGWFICLSCVFGYLQRPEEGHGSPGVELVGFKPLTWVLRTEPSSSIKATIALILNFYFWVSYVLSWMFKFKPSICKIINIHHRAFDIRNWNDLDLILIFDYCKMFGVGNYFVRWFQKDITPILMEDKFEKYFFFNVL